MSLAMSCKGVVICIHISLVPILLWCQTKPDDLTPILEDQLEAFLQNIDDEIDFDFNTLGEHLRMRLNQPLNLNTATLTDLESLELLSDVQIVSLLDYRQRLGNLLSIYELQAIPSFDRRTIAILRPFITLGNSAGQERIAPRMAITGRDELYLRWVRQIELPRGFRPQGDQPAAFEGDPNQIYVRYRHRFENRLSYGFTLEKDPGEALFAGSNTAGFDYVSAHLYLRDASPMLKHLAIGDYSVSLGQGLLMHSGFGRGKSAFPTQIKRGGRVIRPYTSVNESAFLRGGAATLALHDKWQLTLFGSFMKTDGNIRIDSLDGNETSLQFTSFQFSGLHRTMAEIDDENAIGHRVVGAQLSYRDGHNFRLGLNALHNHFDQPLSRNRRLYNQFYFEGKNLGNLSVDYTYLWRNFHFFGETALSDNGAVATTNGLLLGLSSQVDLAILYRNISSRYQAIQANPFLESSLAINEKGVYLGTEIRLNRHFRLSLYADYWKHPWLRFNIDAPSTGQEYLARITYFEKRKVEAYLQYRQEKKAFNNRSTGWPLADIFVGKRQNLRLHLSHKINGNIELRNRLEYAWVNTSDEISQGLLIYQDVIYRALDFPLSFTGRIAYFDSDNYASRIYAYENDILYSFSIPAYFDEGMRYYLNLRYRMSNLVTWEARWEQTRFRNLDQISSGQNQIEGNTRSRFKIQCRLTF